MRTFFQDFKPPFAATAVTVEYGYQDFGLVRTVVFTESYRVLPGDIPLDVVLTADEMMLMADFILRKRAAIDLVFLP